MELLNILLVDDSEAEHFLIKAIIENSFKHIKLYHAYDGAEALEIIRGSAINLILLDLCMPGMDGEEFLKNYNQESLNSPVVILSGLADSPNYQAKFESYDFIKGIYQKPIPYGEIQDVINQAVGKVLSAEN